MADNDKIFPGGIEQYRDLRATREQFQARLNLDESGNFHSTDLEVLSKLVIAEQLAGLAYIADGIRYSLRKG